ncbi:meiotic nuclear division 1 [Pyrrhoderma noxium]|uniref:Meiotic nuclear division protein 1 n=1 Tax=Pyrrhoderma noxium TaxID=2282107 RepID=A0A286UG80_9AGAM|nr:meiotic nuclear division 1 [Pyrrhoderma noxium]
MKRFLLEKKDFFQLKELERLGPKCKGVVSQSVKEVLQSLVDDGLVQADKIGSSNFFWSFPSQRGALMNNRLNTAKEKRLDLQKQLEALRASIETEKNSRLDSIRWDLKAERTSALADLAATKNELSELEKELSQYGSCDPVKIEARRRAVTLAHEAAVRWTDNVVILVSYLSRQYCINQAEIRTSFDINENFEDIC